MNKSQLPNELNRLTHEYEVELNYSIQYFTIVSLVDNNTIGWKASNSNLTKTISISLNNGATWTSKKSTTSGVTLATLSANQIMLVKGSNTAYGTNNISYWNYFTSTGNFNVEGNIMSLIYGDNFIRQTTLSSSYSFKQLFNGCTHLIDASNLILPATALANYCYYHMFVSCTSLTKVPDLPATTLANYCYASMFYNCTSLTEAPELPATTLATNCYSYMFKYCTSLTKVPDLPVPTLTESCYNGMFYGCTSLTKAPELPATTLAGNCYNLMFNECTSLIKAPELPATTLATYCYSQMFKDCTSLTKAPDLSATTLATYCYYSMFYGCTSLTKAPELPATKLAQYCYNSMFYGCSSLNYIKCLATNISASNCLYSWVQNVASTGTFIKADSISSWVAWFSGIPIGWNLYTESEYEVVKHYELTNLIEKHDYSQDYLTIVSLVDNNTIGWKASNSNLTKTISISIDNGATWTSVTSSTSGTTLATLSTNQKMLIKGSNTAYANGAYYNYFTSTGNFNVEGNIMSLVASDNFIGQTSLDSVGYNFKYLFNNCTYLIDAINLILPATTLANYCYYGMFYYCSKLSRAPELPAFILVNGCYASIFYSCLSLYYIRCLATDISASDCLLNWVNGVGENNVIPIENSYIGIFVKADSMNSWTNNNGILSGWGVYNKSENIKHIKYISNLNNLVKSKIVNSNTTIIISPNREHFIKQIYFNTLSNNTGFIQFELDDPIFGIINNYNFHFSASYDENNYSNPILNVSMPDSIAWASDPSFTWGKHYEINIRYNHLLNKFFGVCSSYISI